MATLILFLLFISVAMTTIHFDGCRFLPRNSAIKLGFIGGKMPLFGNKFTPRSIPVRKQDTSVIKNEFGTDYASRELSIDIAPLALKLGDFEISFEDGQWIPASGKAGAAHKENLRLKSELERLEEENNMLRLKFEILLDMMTDKTVEAEQQADIQRAHSMGSLKPKNKKRW